MAETNSTIPLVDDSTPLVFPGRILVCTLTKSVVPQELCQFSIKGEPLRHLAYVLEENIKPICDLFAHALAKLDCVDIDETNLIETKELRKAIQAAVEYLNRKENR